MEISESKNGSDIECEDEESPIRQDQLKENVAGAGSNDADGGPIETSGGSLLGRDDQQDNH